jgi:hypothetical protein
MKHRKMASAFSGNKISNISEVNMYCPKCSQQQVSDDFRFCSRCGFQLSVVKALLGDNETSLTQNSAAEASAGSPRKKDMMIGAALMFLFALRVAWVADDLSLEREFILLIVNCIILCALINVIPMIHDFFRRRSAAHESPASSKIFASLTARFYDDGQNSALPPARSRPATDYFPTGINTAEIVAPPSVTEGTTNLLSSNAN